MQNLNLRIKKKENKKLISELWTTRLTLVQDRKKNEIDVEEQNKKIAQCIKEILEPVAKRIEMPINIEVCEKQTLVHLDFTYNTRTANLSPRVTLTFPCIYEMLSSKAKVETNTQKIESQIRLVKKAIGTTTDETSKNTDIRNKLLIRFPGVVFVTFNTRTRYF